MRPAVAAAHRQLVARPCVPLPFSEMGASTAIALSSELSVRFSHQLERLHHAAEITSASSALQTRSENFPFSVLLALHVDTVSLLHGSSALQSRLSGSSQGDAASGEQKKRWFAVDDRAAFRGLLAEVQGRHSSSTEIVMECVKSRQLPLSLTRPFLTSRISTLVLLEHCTQGLLSKGSSADDDAALEGPTPSTSLAAVAAAAAAEARTIAAFDTGGDCDIEVLITDNTSSNGVATSAPSLVRYVLLELLKNSFRAVAEASLPDPPAIQVDLFDGQKNQTHVCVIHDRGIGMEQREAEAALHRFDVKIPSENSDPWPRGNRASGPHYDRLDHQVSYMPPRSPMHGFGVGLALARIYCEYLGGTLAVESRLGEGTVATLHLPATTSALEKIPTSTTVRIC